MTEEIVKIKELEGQTFTKIIHDKHYHGEEAIIFFQGDDEVYALYHSYGECCEVVCVEDICGELEGLLDTPIVSAYKTVSDEQPGWEGGEGVQQWTFYNINTIKGSVTIRFNGSSNGHYSVGVDFVRLNKGEK